MKTLSHEGSLRTIVSQKRFLITRAFLTCLAVAAFCGTALSVAAVGPTGDAQKAFDDWKAANEAVAAAKKKLATANKELQTAITIITQKGGKQTIDQEAQLERLRAERAAAEAALKEAEAKLLAARIALEKAIAELEADDPLRKDLMRKRDGFIAAQATPVGQASVTTQGGLHKVTFDTLQGRVIVNLPDDMRAGDTISGTVIAEPKGRTPDELAKNKDQLGGYVLEIDGKPIEPFSKICDESRSEPCQAKFFLYHADEKGLNTPVAVKTKEGTEVARTFLPPLLPPMRGDFDPDSKNIIPPGGISRPSPTVPKHPSGAVITPGPTIKTQTTTPTLPDFQLPPIGQQGRPVEIFGVFDGNASNTTFRFGPVGSTTQDFEKNTENVSGGFGLIRPLAESPRKAVFESPTNFTGPVAAMLTEGNTTRLGQYRNVGVRLSAPKTNLMKAEQTVLTVQVSGLEGIRNPVPLQLDATGVITMEAGNFQNLRITPTEVNRDGTYTTTRAITGQQAGAFTVTATVVVSAPPAPGIMLSPVRDAVAEALENALKKKNLCDKELAELRAAAAAAQEAADKARQAAETAEQDARNAQAQAEAARKAVADAVKAVNEANKAVAEAEKERDRANREGTTTEREAARAALDKAKADLAAAQKALKDAQAAIAAGSGQAAAAEAERKAKEKKAEADKAAAALAAAQKALAEKEKECLKAQQDVANAQAAKDKAEQEARARAEAKAAADKAAQERLWAEDIERRRQAQKNLDARAAEIDYLLDNIRELGLITYKPKTNVPDPLDYVFDKLRQLAGQTAGNFAQTVAGELGGGPVPGGVIGALGELYKSIGSFFDPRTGFGQVRILDQLRGMTNPNTNPPRKYNEKEAFDKLKKMQDLMKELRDKLAAAMAGAGK